MTIHTLICDCCKYVFESPAFHMTINDKEYKTKHYELCLGCKTLVVSYIEDFKPLPDEITINLKD